MEIYWARNREFGVIVSIGWGTLVCNSMDEREVARSVLNKMVGIVGVAMYLLI